MGIRSVNETQQQQQQQQWRDEDSAGNNENWRMSEHWSAKCIDNTSCGNFVTFFGRCRTLTDNCFRRYSNQRNA